MGARVIIPLLAYDDIESAQGFLVEAFGFEAGALERDPGGRVVHGEVSLGGAVIWLHRASAEHGLASPRSLPAASGGLVVMVDDVDAHYERARKAGAAIDSPPSEQPYGQREYAARDPEGARWYFATRRSAT
jgi:uncharacterized glyoxalase superfamily protein PhnB